MSSTLSSLGRLFRKIFALDYRSLALLRIGIGVTLICDLIQRLEDLRAFYSDAGVLPRAELLRLWDNHWWISLHMMSGLNGFQLLLILLAGFCAIMLVLGYRTRLFMILSWFFLVSIQVRNPLILQGGDIVLRAIVFWMLFLPLGSVWSLDRLFNRVPRPQTQTIMSAATVAYLLQIVFIYVFTGLLKTGAAWHDGTAIYYALAIDQLVTPIGIYMREFPHLMYYLTFIVWYIEMFGSLLFFIPFKTEFFRMAGIIAFVLLQVGFNSAMRLGLFGMIACVILVGLLPTGFWENGVSALANHFRSKAKKGLTIYYDYDCTFCAKVSIDLKRYLLLSPDTKVLPASEHPEIARVMDRENSWVISYGEFQQIRFGGIIAVLRFSPILFWLAPIFSFYPIRMLGEKLYRYVANKRKLVCEPEPVILPPTRLTKLKRITVSAVIIALLIYVLCWNIDTLGTYKKIITPNLESIAWTLHLDQKWNMFAPTPLTEDGWYVYPGTLRDGTEVNVYDGTSPVSYSKPDLIAYRYPNQRWQKYLMNLWAKDFSDYRLAYGKYICRTWNDSHPSNKQLMNFNMVFMLETTPAPGNTALPIVPNTIWQHHCF